MGIECGHLRPEQVVERSLSFISVTFAIEIKQTLDIILLLPKKEKFYECIHVEKSLADHPIRY